MALAEGRPNRKVNELSREIAEKWRGMSWDEKTKATEKELKELRERRVYKEIAAHHVPAISSEDHVLTCQRIEDSVSLVL